MPALGWGERGAGRSRQALCSRTTLPASPVRQHSLCRAKQGAAAAVAKASGVIETPKLLGLLPFADIQLEVTENTVASQTGWGAPGAGVPLRSSQACGIEGPGCAMGGGKSLTH